MFSLSRPVAVALLLLSWSGVQAQTPLTLAEAERLALTNAVDVRESQAQAQALREQAVADGQLPDPALTLGAMSLPVDSFSRIPEPMTQLTVGVSQAFPPGATLEHQAARTTHMAGAADAEAVARERGLLRDVREAYLELGYRQAALTVLADTQRVLADIATVTKSLYRVGRANLQDVLSAQLEQSLLDDRDRELHAERDAALADLQRWTGALTPDLALPDSMPELPAPPPQEQLQTQLETHPMIAAASARVAAGQSAVETARQQYKPGWMVNVSYGDRIGREADGARRVDLVTAMVTLDLPLFPGKRQDRRVAASVGETEAMRFARDGVYRDLQRELDTDYTRWQRLQERERGYTDRILPAARHNAEAALTAYRNGVTDFTALMRATIAEFDSRLQALRTQTDRLQTQARLNYLSGDKQ
ncbi:MAG: TolC family protein [Gammaproteobacteria bacterium]|nr:TolC family protein [Gammaproteobacteria bacterium]